MRGGFAAWEKAERSEDKVSGKNFAGSFHSRSMMHCDQVEFLIERRSRSP
jgi:hypothetical protein